jgi:sodium-dependent phosphate cotransporter
VATYALANGSVVAATAVSLFETGVVTGSQLFVMVAGSRLGGAAVVVLVGALDYLQKRRYALGEAISLGLLTFLLTHSVYVPATVLGYVLLPRIRVALAGSGVPLALPGRPAAVFEPATTAVVDAVGVGPGFALAVAVLFVGLNLFDRVLKRVDAGWLRRRFFRRFRHRWVAFSLGVVVTGVTTSVAFSLGVVVPLYNRGYLERREVVPYVLGANVGTLFDTVVVALVLESPDGAAIVVALLAVGSLVTLAVLLWFPTYFRVVEAAHVRLSRDRRFLAAFLASLVLVPVGLAVFPA